MKILIYCLALIQGFVFERQNQTKGMKGNKKMIQCLNAALMTHEFSLCVMFNTEGCLSWNYADIDDTKAPIRVKSIANL